MSETDALPCEKDWGHFFAIRHPGPPTHELKERLESLVGRDVVVDVDCTLGGRDIVIVKATGDAMEAARRVILETPYAGGLYHDRLGYEITPKMPATLLREFKLGHPLDPPSGRAAQASPTDPAPNVAYILAHVHGTEDPRANVHNAWHDLKPKIRPRVLSVHEVIDQEALLIKLAFGRIEEVYHLVGKVIPTIAEIRDTDTFAVIRLADAGGEAQRPWEDRIVALFEKSPNARYSTPQLAHILDARQNCFWRALKKLEATGYLRSHHTSRCVYWSRRDGTQPATARLG